VTSSPPAQALLCLQLVDKLCLCGQITQFLKGAEGGRIWRTLLRGTTNNSEDQLFWTRLKHADFCFWLEVSKIMK